MKPCVKKTRVKYKSGKGKGDNDAERHVFTLYGSKSLEMTFSVAEFTFEKERLNMDWCIQKIFNDDDLFAAEGEPDYIPLNSEKGYRVMFRLTEEGEKGRMNSKNAAFQLRKILNKTKARVLDSNNFTYQFEFMNCSMFDGWLTFAEISNVIHDEIIKHERYPAVQKMFKFIHKSLADFHELMMAGNDAIVRSDFTKGMNEAYDIDSYEPKKF